MIQEELKISIKETFPKITTPEHLLSLMKMVYCTLYASTCNTDMFSLKTLLFMAFNKQNMYCEFEIPKKNGGFRKISSPIPQLKAYQEIINIILQSVFIPHKNAFGFIPGKSIVDNAKRHVGRRYVYNIDLESFFPSINFRRVKTVLSLPPFNLFGEKEELAYIIANICCAGKDRNDSKGFLPQGAPTSPTITNIICQRLDRKLSILAKKNKAIYSRYADDITFSSNNDMFNEDFFQKLKSIIIYEENFKINEKKIRLQDFSMRQEVTGIIVNKKTNLPPNYIDNLRFWLFLWEKFGKVKATNRFHKDYHNEKGFLKYRARKPKMEMVIRGKLDFLSMVRGSNDELYVKLKNKFLILTHNKKIIMDKKPLTSSPDILTILKIWQKKGINDAINLLK